MKATDPDESQARRRAWRRAIVSAVLVALSSPMLVTLVATPVLGVLIASVPQVAVFVPQPVREVTVVLDGLPSWALDPATGADGVDGVEVDPEAPVVADADGNDAAAPSAGDEADGAAPVDALPGTAPTTPTKPKPSTPKPENDPDAPSEPDGEAPAADPNQGDGETPEPTDGQATGDGTTAATPTAKPGKPGRCSEPNPAIKKVADGSWAVQRSLIDHYTSSMERFNSLGYSHKWEDETTGEKGWQIGGFGCSSPLWKAGLRSKDVIQTVNGKRTYNMFQLIGIWISQRNKDKFEVTLLRKGQPLTLHYEIL